MTAQLEVMLDQFLKKHQELDPDAAKDNRKQLVMGIEDLHNSVISPANLENVLRTYSDVFIYRKRLPEIFWPVKDQIAMLDECSQILEFKILPTNANIGAILSLLQHSGTGVVSLENVLAACQALGKSGLEHYSPAPLPPPPPPAPRPARFDWEPYVTDGLELPLDCEVPQSILQRCTLDQVKSLVRRQDMQKKPWISGRDQGMTAPRR
jgi:hypothetical protein